MFLKTLFKPFKPLAFYIKAKDFIIVYDLQGLLSKAFISKKTKVFLQNLVIKALPYRLKASCPEGKESSF
jgi:hypothetical protein